MATGFFVVFLFNYPRLSALLLVTPLAALSFLFFSLMSNFLRRCFNVTSFSASIASTLCRRRLSFFKLKRLSFFLSFLASSSRRSCATSFWLLSSFFATGVSSLLVVVARMARWAGNWGP